MVNKKALSILLVSIVIMSTIVAIFLFLHTSEEIDNIAPIVVIVSPKEDIHDSAVQLLEIIASDIMGVDTIWYHWKETNISYISPQYILFTSGTHTIKVWANDTAGNIGSASATFAIASPCIPFVSDWETTQLSAGSSDVNQVRLPLVAGGEYLFGVDWGDGLSDIINSWNQPEATHTYATPGVYTVRIIGKLIGWRFNNGGDRLKLLEISQWGQLRVGNSGSYFYGCSNLNVTATDSLDLTGTTYFGSAFKDCANLGATGNMNSWDVSSVTYMSQVFSGALTFNQDISDWDVSSVEIMDNMFSHASAFNQDIGAWDVSSVIDMGGMFYGASAFNQDIGSWDVSGVIYMNYMFSCAEAFNQDIGAWDISSVTQIGSMFRGAFAFNQNISEWNVSRVTNLNHIFSGALAFNGDISEWDVSSVTDMSFMFEDALAFNQDIGDWNVSRVLTMRFMFYGAALSTVNYDSLLIGWSQLTLQYGVTFHGGGSKYSAGTAADARQYIINTYGWTITDGGQA